MRGDPMRNFRDQFTKLVLHNTCWLTDLTFSFGDIFNIY